MRKKLMTRAKRAIAAGLSLALIVQSSGSSAAGMVYAKETEPLYNYLSAATMPEEIQDADTFYVGTTSAELKEEEKPYLLQIGRGGDATKEASVVLKISDATASYGKDYKIRLHSEEETEDETEAVSPEDNKSLLDIISENEVEEDLQLSEEEQNAAVEKSKQELLSAVEDAKKESNKKNTEDDSWWEEEGSTPDNPLAQAKETLTGIKSDREDVTSTQQNMVDMLSDVGNNVTQVLPGATLKVDFAPYEDTKYVEIIPIDNKESDGNRIFYVTLSEPSEGMTNSSVSESMFTILDDEPQQDATISFEKTEFTADTENNYVEVVLKRTGNMTENVSVHMTSQAGTAVSGQDFAPVDADVLFPFGVKERKLKITVRSDYLTQDSDFTLSLKKGTGAVVGENGQTKVILKAEVWEEQSNDEKAKAKTEKKAEKSVEKKGEVSTQAGNLPTKRGNKINLHKAAWKIFGIRDQWEVNGNNGLPEGKIWSYVKDEGYIYIGVALSGDKGQTTDVIPGKFQEMINKFGLAGTGVASMFARKQSSTARQYVYDGFRFSWFKSSDKSSWSTSKVLYYGANGVDDERELYNTGDKPRFNWEEREYYFGNTDATAAVFYCDNDGGKPNVMQIDWVVPILRPFKVELAQADPLSYLDGSGDSKSTNYDAVASELVDSSGGYAVKYDGGIITINSRNYLLGISQLAGVQIVCTNGASKKVKAGDTTTIDKRFLNGFKVGDTAIQVSLNNDFCTEYAEYIGYEGNGGSSLRGKIKLKPVYKYIDSKITFQKNNEMIDGDTVDCKLLVNGKEINYGNATYHMGDTLKLSAKIDDDRYVCNKVEYVSKGEPNAITKEFQQGACNLCLNSPEYKYIMPRIYKRDNCMVVRVKKEDKEHFLNKGIFEQKYFREHHTEGNGYYEITVATTQELFNQIGKRVTLAVQEKDGYVPIWKETNGDRYFMGSVFDCEAKSRKEANVIYLYAAKKSSQDYSAIRTRIYYENLALNNQAAAGEPIFPAVGGYLSVAGQCVTADADGNVQTAAFPLPQSSIVDINNRTVGIDDKLYMRVIAGANGATQYNEVKLVRTEKVDIADVDGVLHKTYLTNQSDMKISTNTGEYTRFKGISTTNKGISQNDVRMNDEDTKLSASVIEINTEKEKVTGVDYLIYDWETNEIKHTIKAQKINNQWEASYKFKEAGEAGKYRVGDRIYVQMTTSKKAQITENEDNEGNPILEESKLSEDAKEVLNQTVYAPVNTGYVLKRVGKYEEPTVQKLDIGSVEGVSGIPMVNNFNSNLNLGPLTLQVTNLYDDKKNVCGTRIYAMLGLKMVKDWGSKNRDLSDTNKKYDAATKVIKSLVNDGAKAALSTVGDIANQVDHDAFMAGTPYGDELASFGAKKWGVYPTVGFYMDFSVKSNTSGGMVSDSHYVLTGGGVYVGATGNFSVAWYAMIPVVYIPCYFGVAGELSIDMSAGAATNVKHEEKDIEYDGFTATSHNLSETLGFDYKFHGAAQIQIYCGVGICGTLGVRGGVQLNGDFIWYPTNQNFSKTGFEGSVTFKMWVDLLLFTVPIPVYTFGPKKTGLYEELDKLEKQNEDSLDDLISKNNKSSSTTKSIKKSSAGEEDSDLQKVMQNAEIHYELKNRENDPSKWSGNMKGVSADAVKTMATYKEKNSHTLLTDGYDRPDSQMMDMGEYGTLLVFLQDDKSRTDAERTAISYSVYKDGKYSTPVVIQTDETADFQPNITDAGDNVIVTWISSPLKDKGDEQAEDYQNKYLKSQEVYAVSIPKADLSDHKEILQDTIVRLTEDEYYDSEPTAVYDKKSGDINVYYIKTAEDTDKTAEATDLANPMNASQTTYSVIAYRVYDNANKKWLVDEYAEKEKPETVSDEAYKKQLQELGGQRMLMSPIQAEDVNMEDPLIADFTAIGYNGKIAFAYTIDKDNSADTDEDRELFVQIYDFATRSTYLPIRITEDEESDTKPQLVRRGSDEEGTTYLFWKHGDTLQYIDVSSLVKYGIDENGKIREQALKQPEEEVEESDTPDEDIYQGMTEEQKKRATYTFQINKVDAYGADENRFSSYSQYQVATDAKDNIYVVWVDACDGSGQEDGQEIFASAMIESGELDDEKNVSKDWSQPNKLTNFEKYCDEPAFAITKEGKMLIVYNKYDIKTTGTEENQVIEVTDMELASSLLEPYGSVEANSIVLSDVTPVAGQEVQIGIQFQNTGLTAAEKGFTAEIYEKTKEGEKKLLETYQYDNGLVATGTVDEIFSYTANENTVGSTIEVVVTENDIEGTNINQSAEFVNGTEYDIVQNNSYQGADSKFYSEIIVTNTGNQKSSEGDNLQVEFAGPYEDARAYGLDNSTLASEAVSLEPGESKKVTLTLDVPASVFSYYGRIETRALVVDQQGAEYAYGENETIWLKQPAGLTLNGNQDMELEQDDSIDLELEYTTVSGLFKVTPSFVSDNTEVAWIEDGKLYAVGEGTAVITAYAAPYTAQQSIKVTVKEAQNTEPAMTPEVTGTLEPVTTPDGTGTPAPVTAPAVTETPAPVTTSDNGVNSLGETKITKMVSDSSSKMTLEWEKVENASGYEVTYATNKTFTKNTVTKRVKKTSVTLSKLKKSKTYYVRVRAYSGEGEATITGSYSAIKIIKLSPRPSKILNSTVTAENGKILIAVKKSKNTTGYEYVLSTDKKGKKKVKVVQTKKQKAVFKNLEAKKNYYITIRAYRKTKEGAYLYGAKKTLKKRTK